MLATDWWYHICCEGYLCKGWRMLQYRCYCYIITAIVAKLLLLQYCNYCSNTTVIVAILLLLLRFPFYCCNTMVVAAMSLLLLQYNLLIPEWNRCCCSKKINNMTLQHSWSGYLMSIFSADTTIKLWSARDECVIADVTLDETLSCAAFLNSSADIVFGFANNLYSISIETCKCTFSFD